MQLPPPNVQSSYVELNRFAVVSPHYLTIALRIPVDCDVQLNLLASELSAEEEERYCPETLRARSYVRNAPPL